MQGGEVSSAICNFANGFSKRANTKEAWLIITDVDEDDFNDGVHFNEVVE